MDYLSFKFLNRGPDLDRKSDERLRKPPPPASPQAAAAPSPTSIKTPTYIKTSNSTNSPHRTQQPSPRSSVVITNNDPLPTSFAALEGHLNHHASQLQQLADRVESINEWIELDNIVLARLVRDEEKRIEEVIAAEKATAAAAVIKGGDIIDTATPEDGHKGVRFALVPMSPTSGFPLGPPSEKMAKRSASMGDVPRSPALSAPRKSDAQRKEEAIEAHGGVREVRGRIRGMKRWRKELERSVVWQREEFWRVEGLMGKSKGGERESVGMAGDGKGEGKENSKEGAEEKVGERGGLSVVGGAQWEDGKKEKWSRDSAEGRLPTQREWEALFTYS